MHACHQALRNRLQELIADGMAQGIIDVFEAIKVQEQYRALIAVAASRCHFLMQPVV